MAREHRLGVAFALAIMLWASAAFADVIANPTSLTLAPAAVNSTSAVMQVAITKGSGGPAVTLTIGNCSGAAGNFNYPASVTAPATIDISYYPTAVGTRTCTITASNGNTPDATINVSGSGYQPPTIATQLQMPSTFPSVRFLDGAVAGFTSTRTITVSNGTGNNPLTISNVTFTGDFSIDPSSTYGTSTTINGGAAKTWTLRFNPSQLGTRNGSVTFHNDASNAPSGMTTVNLTGTGTSGTYSIAQAANGAFGTVASGTTAGIDIDVTHDGNNPKGTLTFSTVTISNATQPWFAISAQPTTINPSVTTTGTITVTCSPPPLSILTATATVNIQADADSMAMKTQAVSCTGGASQLALNISMIDMDPTLLGTTSPTKMITVQNTGTSDANVGFSSSSTHAPRFTVTGPGGCGAGANNCAVPMGGGMITVTMTFTPTLEATVSASFNVQGAGAAPSFTVTGRGIDRRIFLQDAIQFEDEFRNPGSRARTTPVTVTNQGEYPILISELMLGGPGAELFTLDETQTLPITVPGLSTADVLVKFQPREAGKADDGQLLIRNDDVKFMGGSPLVILSGNGKDRNVDMTPLSAFLGETFAGIPTRLSVTKPEGVEHLTVKNNELTDGTGEGRTNFTIREIKVQAVCSMCDPEALAAITAMFKVVDKDGNSLEGRKLDAQSQLEVDVEFNPTYPGEFDAQLLLYLDEDPIPQMPVTVRGRALYIDAHGSGGCSIGHSGHGGLVLLLGALGLVVRRRRR